MGPGVLASAMLVLCLGARGAAGSPPEILPPLQPPSEQDRQSQAILTKRLREALAAPDPQTRDRILVGLRKLRDPSLTPLFAQLSMADEPVLRVNGLLGLAELEPRRGIDLLAVSKVADPQLQGWVLLEAVNEGLVPEHSITELTGWTSLHPWVRLLIAGRCVRDGRAFDRVEIVRLAQDPDPLVALKAAMILRQASLETVLVDRIVKAQAPSLARGPRPAIEEFAFFASSFRLTGALDVLRSIEKYRPGGDAILSDVLLAAQLVTAPKDDDVIARGVARFGATVPVVQRNYFALRVMDAALELGRLTPPPVVKAMSADADPLIRAMGQALEPIAQGPGSNGEAIAQLAARAHAPTVDWAVRAAERRHWQDARAIRKAVIEAVRKREPGTAPAPIDPRLARLAASAAQALADDDPTTLERPLAEAISATDAPVVRIILSGLLRSINPGSGALVRQGAFEPRPTGPWPDQETAAMALLISIRHGEPTANPAERIQRLTNLARGIGGLDDVLCSQAAWLALRGSGRDRVALARILSDIASKGTDTKPVPPPPAPTPPPAKNQP